MIFIKTMTEVTPEAWQLVGRKAILRELLG
jgi:hypothetical protein